MTAYVGRFAPSPTGSLHFGSLVAAVASFCDARANHGKWLLRMEDVDQSRSVKGAANSIIQTLEEFGFEWDTEIIYQSQRREQYEAHLEKLKLKNLVYACTCSRKEINLTNPKMGIEGAIYPKTCLNNPIKQNKQAAWRIHTPNEMITFKDEVQGLIEQNISQEIGDFILLRADKLFAYQLAVVTDDAAQGVTHVIRGADLLLSTPRQIYLQHLLDLATPSYAHIPIICNSIGEKLSKQTLAKTIKKCDASALTFKALSLLNQEPPTELINEPVQTILNWGVDHWQLNAVGRDNLTIED